MTDKWIRQYMLYNQLDKLWIISLNLELLLLSEQVEEVAVGAYVPAEHAAHVEAAK